MLFGVKRGIIAAKEPQLLRPCPRLVELDHHPKPKQASRMLLVRERTKVIVM